MQRELINESEAKLVSIFKMYNVYLNNRHEIERQKLQQLQDKELEDNEDFDLNICNTTLRSSQSSIKSQVSDNDQLGLPMYSKPIKEFKRAFILKK